MCIVLLPPGVNPIAVDKSIISYHFFIITPSCSWQHYCNVVTYSMQHSPSWEANRFSASQEIPRVYGPRRFITTFISARHLSLSWAISIQSMASHPISWRSILILSSHLRLGVPSGLFPSGYPTKALYTLLLSPHKCCIPRLTRYSLFDLPNKIRWGVQII